MTPPYPIKLSIPLTLLAPASLGPEAKPEEMLASTQQPYEEADFSDDSTAVDNDNDSAMPVDITVDSPIKAALPQAEDLIAEELIQPPTGDTTSPLELREDALF